MAANYSANVGQSDDLGQFLGDFPDVRGTPAQIVGLLLAVPGAALFALAFVPGWEMLRVFSILMLVVGALAIVLGVWRNRSRVLVYASGFVHQELGVCDRYLWRDLQVIEFQREKTTHAIGLMPLLTFRMSCRLQHKDGHWSEVQIPPLPEIAMKVLRESWEEYTMSRMEVRVEGQITL